MTPSVIRPRTAQQRILAEDVERQNGQTLALPLSSPNTPPSHPSPLMQVMPSAGLPNFLLRACQGSSELVRRHHMVPVAQETQVKDRVPSPRVSQPRASLSVHDYGYTSCYLYFQLRKLVDRTSHVSNTPNGRQLR